MQTNFAEPDSKTTTELVEQLLADVGEVSSPTRWQWVRSGSSSIVVLAGDVAVRVGRDEASARELQRTQVLVDRLPRLSFAVPRSLAAPRTHLGLTGVAVQRMRGEPHPPEAANPTVLRAVLDELHAIPLEGVRRHLAPARAFYGGEAWQEVLTNDVATRLPVQVQATALARIGALAALETPRRVVNHGDLAGFNMHWHHGEVVAVLDWDLTSEEDPAEDLATLCSWHGWHLAAQIADPPEVRRAEVFRDAFPLMTVGFATLRNRPEDEIERAVERAAARLSL